MQIKNLYGKKLMVDTNAFIYYLTDQCNNLTVEIFEAGALGRIQLITTTGIVNELIFKMLLIEAGRIYGWKTKVFEKLKKEPEKVKRLAGACEKVMEFLDVLNVEVIEIRKNALRAICEIISEYGLMGNDAVTLKVIKERNLKYILTADGDFKRVKELIVLDPLK